MSEISTVQETIVRMGTAAVRNLVVTVCFYSRMQDRNIYGERGKPLLEHGIGTAYMARLLAEWLGLDEEEAFMYGLLHDIGKLVILKAAFASAGRRAGRHDGRGARQRGRARAAPLAAAEHARRADRLPSRLDARHRGAPQGGGHVLRQPPEPPLRVWLRRRPGGSAVGSFCKELGIDRAGLDQTDKRAPGLVDVAKKILG